MGPIDCDVHPTCVGIKPLLRIVSMAVAGVAPQLMGIGTVPASVKALGEGAETSALIRRGLKELAG